MITRKYFYKTNVFRILFIFIAIFISFSSYPVGNGITTTSQKITVSIDPKEDKTNQASSNRGTKSKRDIELDSQVFILKSVRTPEIKFDTGVAALLEKFKNKPDSLELINELTDKEEALLQHVQQQVNSGSDKLDIAVTIEALSLINSPSAMSFLVSLENKILYDFELNTYILRYLREMPHSESADFYLNLLLKMQMKESLFIQNVLLSMAIYEAPDIAKWAAYYRSPGINPDIRFLGLYLSSMLGKDETLQRWILEILFDENKPLAYQHYYLLVALSRQMSDESFYDFLSRSYVAKRIIDDVKLERLFYQGDVELRLQLAPQLINSNYVDQRNAAISFLLKEQGFEKAWQQLNQQQRLSAIRLSYRLSVPFVSPNIDESFSDNYLWYVFILGAISLIVFVGFRSSKL